MMVIGVDEPAAEAGGQQTADRRLAGTGDAHEENDHRANDAAERT